MGEGGYVEEPAKLNLMRGQRSRRPSPGLDNPADPFADKIADDGDAESDDEHVEA